MHNEYLEHSIKRLKSVIDDSGTRPILFIGTGLSIRYLGAPSWIELLNVLIHRNKNCKYPIAYYEQSCENNPQIASLLIEEYKDYAWDNYKKEIYPKSLYEENSNKSMYLKHEIRRIFKRLMANFNLEDNPHTEEIRLLGKLNPHAIITTNYDKMLEIVFPEYDVTIGQQVIKSNDSLRIGQILKIHGCMDKPEEIVISQEDYVKFQEKQKYLTAKLLTYFMENPIIFLGYSLSDSNIKKILLDIAEMVCESPEEIVDNIWFVEWSEIAIPLEDTPPIDKIIDLGNGKTIRINYILLHNYEELYKSLDQGDVSSVNALQNLEDRIYNIVKSKSISELRVNYLTMEHINDEESLARALGFQRTDRTYEEESRNVSVIGVGVMSDPEQIKLRFPFRLSDVAKQLGLTHWVYANQLIETVAQQTGVNIKENSNRYHFDISVVDNEPQHRYSSDTVELLNKVLIKEPYSVYDKNNNLVQPVLIKENLKHKQLDLQL